MGVLDSPTCWKCLPLPENEAGPLELRLKGMSTHMSLWPASTSLFCWLVRNHAKFDLMRPGLRVLELGSGTGWLGSCLAANLPDAETIVMTEHPSAAARLATKSKDWVSAWRAPAVRVATLDWADFLMPGAQYHSHWPDGGNFDVVLAADCVWTEETAVCFAAAARAALESAGRSHEKPPLLIYGYWLRSPRLQGVFLARCAAAGLVLTTLDMCYEGCSVEATPILESDDKIARAASASTVDEDEIDWNGCLFEDADSGFLPPFIVYQITLGQ